MPSHLPLCRPLLWKLSSQNPHGLLLGLHHLTRQASLLSCAPSQWEHSALCLAPACSKMNLTRGLHSQSQILVELHVLQRLFITRLSFES